MLSNNEVFNFNSRTPSTEEKKHILRGNIDNIPHKTSELNSKVINFNHYRIEVMANSNNLMKSKR